MKKYTSIGQTHPGPTAAGQRPSLQSSNFSPQTFYRAEIRSAQLVAEQTIVCHAILSHASLSVCMLQQHMVVTCCQGSLSPGPSSPAWGQMAAHWALKSKKLTARDTVHSTLPTLALPVLPGGLGSLHPRVNIPTLLFLPVI